MKAQDESRAPYGGALPVINSTTLSDEDILARADEIARKRLATGVDINSSTSAYHAIKALMQQYDEEHFCILWLDCQHKIIKFEDVFTGTIEHCTIHSRILVKHALELNAAACILVHNHPSGTTAPSDADIAITKQIIEAGKLLGLELVDHVIVTRNAFASVPADYLR